MWSIKRGSNSMSPLMLELVVLLIVFILCIILIILRSFKQGNTLVTITLAIFLLINAFIVIHLFFCYQIGFPASKTQDNFGDLTLGSSDWLSFLGGYLGFAGSLVMACLVYHQSNVINKLTVSEYAPSASLIIQHCVKSIDHENYIENNIVQSIPGNDSDKYYTLHYSYTGNADDQWDSCKSLVFAEIVNNSKSTIKNLSFSAITLEEISPSCQCYEYENDVIYNANWDPADKTTDILPGGKVKRCFVIDKIPHVIGMGWMSISFSCSENHLFKAKVLVSKSEDHELTFLNESNGFVFDN